MFHCASCGHTQNDHLYYTSIERRLQCSKCECDLFIHRDLLAPVEAS